MRLAKVYAYEDMRALYENEKKADKYYLMSAIEGYKELFENCRYALYKIEPFLGIILEKTDAFFNGVKSKE